jgi:predicted transcriptional regulator YdeE
MILISHSRISINDCPNFGVRINPSADTQNPDYTCEIWIAVKEKA